MRTETRTYEVYNLHELTREAQVKAHSHWAEHSTMVGKKQTERHYKPLNRYPISRWTDGHTMIIPIGIVSLLITTRKKIIWKGVGY